MTKPIQKKRLPTKKQEQEFLNNLSPEQKSFVVIEVPDTPQYTYGGNWNGVVYQSKIMRLLHRLFRTKESDKMEL